MCSMFLVFDPPGVQWDIFRLHDDGSTGVKLRRDGSILRPGSYVVLDDHGQPVNVDVTSEDAPRRIVSRSGSTPKLSQQNGLLLAAEVHAMFDLFQIAVNPDAGFTCVSISHFTLTTLEDGYKVIVFGVDYVNYGGRILSTTATNSPKNNDRVSADALRWHFRMAVLANTKRAGQVIEWEYDLGEDDIGEILEGPDVAERMELELFSHLGVGTCSIDPDA
ncbi:hypothetical protein VTN77DRAFT_3975 [Rasamsonia byssochlamydoides]|uniref:uncharacterized protein n=1 Tax=Rasamsonia byssochlamydoides TaxID=89139 RepID=UPI0037446692